MARWMTLWRVFTSRSVWTTLPPTKQLNARQQGHKSYNFRSTCVQFFTVYRSLGPRFSRTLLQPLQLSFHSLASLLFLVSTHNNQKEGYLDEHMSFCYSLPQALHKPMCLSSCLHSKISISFLNPQSSIWPPVFDAARAGAGALLPLLAVHPLDSPPPKLCWQLLFSWMANNKHRWAVTSWTQNTQLETVKLDCSFLLLIHVKMLRAL